MSSPDDEEVIDERAPLLRHDSSSHDLFHRQGQRWWSTVPFTITRMPQSLLIPLIGSLTIFLNESEFYIKNPAQVRAIESMACYEYYSQTNNSLAHLGKNIPELMCKEAAVQDRVATLFGMVYVVRTFCSVIGTMIMLGVFKAGRRRPILISHKMNILTSNLLLLIAYYGYPKLPIWFVCLNGIPAIFGGNYDLGTSTMFAAYADVMPDKTRRSNLIFISSSMQYVSQVVCLPITSYLMNLNGRGTTPQVSLFVATSLAVLVLLLNIFFMPETFRPEFSPSAENQDGNTTPDGKGFTTSETSATILPVGQDTIQRAQNDTMQPPVSKPKSQNPFTVLRDDFGLLRVTFLLLAIFFAVTSTRLVDWYGLLQYPSIKFHWTLSKTTYLICMQGALSFVNSILILPSINKVCQQRFGVSAESTSVGIAIASALILMICSIVFGLPGTSMVLFIITTAIYALGSGVNSALQTYTVSVASTPRSSGAALTISSLAATAGKFAASAIWPATLHFGLGYPSGTLVGLPFLTNALLLVCVAVAVVLVDRTAKRKKTGQELSSDN